MNRRRWRRVPGWLVTAGLAGLVALVLLAVGFVEELTILVVMVGWLLLFAVFGLLVETVLRLARRRGGRPPPTG